MEKILEFTNLADIGKGSARVTDNSVEIYVTGINGGMKAWLIGGEAVSIGNLVDGRLNKKVNTANHSGILITQSGRQLFIVYYNDTGLTSEIPDFSQCPFEKGDFNWKKFTGKNYSSLSDELRYILSNRSVYENFKKYGHYWVGQNSGSCALALKCDSEENPLAFLKCKKTHQNGYVIVTLKERTVKA